VTGDRDEVLINASWGLGESIVGGTATPDTFVVRKPDLEVTSLTIADKGRMTVSVPGGTREVNVPRFLRMESSLVSPKFRPGCFPYFIPMCLTNSHNVTLNLDYNCRIKTDPVQPNREDIPTLNSVPPFGGATISALVSVQKGANGGATSYKAIYSPPAEKSGLSFEVGRSFERRTGKEAHADRRTCRVW
jgi:hypothetical protein